MKRTNKQKIMYRAIRREDEKYRRFIEPKKRDEFDPYSSGDSCIEYVAGYQIRYNPITVW